MTTDELTRAYRLWRSAQHVEDLITAYRHHTGRVQVSILQEAEGPPTYDYETIIGMESIGYAIIDALEQRLASYRYELPELG
jgi:hypothetical protein